MSEYSEYGLKLTEKQKQQIANAHKNSTGCLLRLSKSALEGDDKLKITSQQAGKLMKALKAKKGLVLKLSGKQIKASKKINGGFLGALLAGLLPSLLPMGMDLIGKVFNPTGRGIKGIGNWVNKNGRELTNNKQQIADERDKQELMMQQQKQLEQLQQQERGNGIVGIGKKNTSNLKGYGLRIM